MRWRGRVRPRPPDDYDTGDPTVRRDLRRHGSGQCRNTFASSCRCAWHAEDGPDASRAGRATAVYGHDPFPAGTGRPASRRHRFTKSVVDANQPPHRANVALAATHLGFDVHAIVTNTPSGVAPEPGAASIVWCNAGDKPPAAQHHGTEAPCQITPPGVNPLESRSILD